jgi:hypothetical protein
MPEVKDLARIRERKRLWREKNIDRVRAYFREYDSRRRGAPRKRRPGSIRAYLLRKKFGLTVDQYTALLESQGGRCAICRRIDPGRALSVDHDHQSGRVRGLLCSSCNVLLGHAREDPTTLVAAITYLEQRSLAVA